MFFSVLLVISAVFTVESINIKNFETIPKPVHDFNAHKYAGLWYLYATTQPCSWNGAYGFTDWTQYYEVPSADRYEYTDTYRTSGSCTKIKSKGEAISNGVYRIKDAIGNVFSGKLVYVDVDYDQYVFTWGCVDMSMDGYSCKDGWITVKTRQLKPSAKVLAKIEAKLKALWGITTRDIGLVEHGNHCVPPKPHRPPTRYGQPHRSNFRRY